MLVIPELNQNHIHLKNDRNVLVGEGFIGLNIDTFCFNYRFDYQERFGWAEKFNWEYHAYGVADNVDQILNYYKNLIDSPDHKIILTAAIIRKSEQESQGGWRWHKWGEYIGTKDPQCEYIYDEDDSIQEVLCFHCYLLNDHE